MERGGRGRGKREAIDAVQACLVFHSLQFCKSTSPFSVSLSLRARYRGWGYLHYMLQVGYQKRFIARRNESEESQIRSVRIDDDERRQ